MSSYITDKCPKCGGTAYADGVDVGVGYYYEPLHCACGWSEMCSEYDEEDCKKCTMYSNCFGKKYKEEYERELKNQKCPNCNSKNIGIDKWDMFDLDKDYFYYCKECDCTFGK